MHPSNAQALSGAGLDVAAGTSGADPRPAGISLLPDERAAVQDAVLGLDRWLDSMRQPGGYGGQVSHWWSDCLDYTDPGLDWRYEGIIIGYLNLWLSTRENTWLLKAKTAGNDLVNGQLPSGNFRNSCFELNPNTGGTPHEAACDLALLRLAQTLRSCGDEAWETYAAAAGRNLLEYSVRRLWDAETRSFRDDPAIPSFVPNKACTLVEALFALSRVTREDRWIKEYALPTLHAVLDHQMHGGTLDGAICQNSFGKRKVDKYFPFYIARCLPGLLEGWAWSGDERLADAVRRAAGFILRWRYPDGSFPQVVYPRGRVNRYPQWIAAVGDILRALDLARTAGVSYDAVPTQRWLLTGRKPDGAIRTAVGFGRASLVSGPDARDELGVCGWADKSFRYLTGLLAEDTAVDDAG